jgi:predicted aldo/keto reductase-like oxidoreductase
VLQDKRVHLLTIGMRRKKEVDANIQTLAGDATLTTDDRAVPAEISAQALESEVMKTMKTE